MGFLSTLTQAHRWVAERVNAGDVVIDATAGAGVDTLALAKLIGRKGAVHAFDVQPEAIERTRTRLLTLDPATTPAIHLHCASHDQMREYVIGSEASNDAANPSPSIAAVMFNLGYLPGGSREDIITTTDSTLPALDAALSMLRSGGIITCVLYPGHPGGSEEAAAVEQWASNLPVHAAQVMLYRQLQRNDAPYLIGIEKKRMRQALNASS